MRLHQMVQRKAEVRENKRLRRTFFVTCAFAAMWLAVIGVTHQSFLSMEDNAPARVPHRLADLEEPDIGQEEPDPAQDYTEEELELLWEIYIITMLEDEIYAPDDDFWIWLGYYDDFGMLDDEEEPPPPPEEDP
jgi:hypothetical protein